MISPIYMALGSVCKTHSRLPQYALLAIQGDFSGARELARQARERFNDTLSVSCMNQAAADMSILLGDYEQAESFYACSVSGLAGSPYLNAASCRATGIQALFQNRFDVATHCFRRNTEEGVSVEYQLESYATLALIYREVGLDKESHESFSKLKNLVATTNRQAWCCLSNLVGLDLAAYRAVYSRSTMSDHIFRSMNGVNQVPVQETVFIEKPGNSSLGQALSPLLIARKNHLMKMIDLAGGKKVDWNDLQNFSQFPFAENSRLCMKYSCLEIGLAAVAGGHHDIAQKLMLKYSWLGTHWYNKAKSTARIDQNELLYFLAKMQTKNLTIEDNNSFYHIYLESAFKAIHQFTNKLQKIVSNGLVNAYTHASGEPLKKVAEVNHSSRLVPVLCQQAYDYIQENSWRSDVSVREVASIIGVSERWLQLQFKRHYGCSPKAMIRVRQ
jgi:hypothetical protein